MSEINSTNLAERFWAKVNKTDSCWLWTGSFSGKGYGKLHLSLPNGPRGPDGRRSRRMLWAHRISWELAFGPVPEGREVLHNCPGQDNPRCVNPAHLMLGTHAENMIDAVKKGQMSRGESRPAAKLTDVDVREIRLLYATGEYAQQRLAVEFGVSPSQIWGIVNAKTWRHVS